MFGLDDPIEWQKLVKMIENGEDPLVWLIAKVRNLVGVINYLNSARTHPRFMNILNDYRDDWQRSQNVWNAANPNRVINMVAFHDDWTRDYLRAIVNHARTWASQARQWAEATLPTNGNDYVSEGIASLRTQINSLYAANIDINGLH
jgi:hypothetical protein